jgi:hypothetical protein
MMRLRLLLQMKGYMVPKILLGAALGIGAAVVLYANMSDAQEPACRFFKVQSDNVNISKEPRGDSTYIDVLDSGEIVCVTREQKADGRDWAFIVHKLAKPPGTRKPVNGWANARVMQPASPGELAAAQGTPVAPAPAPTAQAPSASPGSSPAASGEKVVRFADPIPFGPVAVAGKTLEQLAAADAPLFPPIEGIPEALWKKPCAACHKWNKETLCDQGASYVKNPASAFRNQHPYGGPMKLTLLEWAKQGCQ